MKKISIIAAMLLFALSSCNQNAELEKRIAALEKSNEMKDKQIEGLSLLAYYHDLDTTATVDNDSSSVALTVFKQYNIPLLPIAKITAQDRCGLT